MLSNYDITFPNENEIVKNISILLSSLIYRIHSWISFGKITISGFFQHQSNLLNNKLEKVVWDSELAEVQLV